MINKLVINTKWRLFLDLLDIVGWILVGFWFFLDVIYLPTPNKFYVTVTAYQNTFAQTDNSPFITSIGTPSIGGTCAVSQDLLRKGKLKYGDNISIPGLGVFKVMDCMNKRWINRVDVLVWTRTQVKLVGKRKNVLVRKL